MSAPITPQFTLIDHNESVVTERSYQGRWLIVYFGFTNCAVICPRTLGKLTDVLGELGETARKIAPLYITVDPDRDTPERMRTFLQTSYPLFTGLTGSTDQIARARSAFRVFSGAPRPAPGEGQYDVPHTGMTFLVDTVGLYAKHWSETTNAETITHDIKTLISLDGSVAEPLPAIIEPTQASSEGCCSH